MYHYDDKLKLIIIWSDVSRWYIDYIDIFRLLFAPWFIKWLVEQDKIDKDNEDLISLMSELWEFNNYEKCLLMLLSIQDNPIEFLVSILK